jgi:hypothetical protein
LLAALSHMLISGFFFVQGLLMAVLSSNGRRPTSHCGGPMAAAVQQLRSKPGRRRPTRLLRPWGGAQGTLRPCAAITRPRSAASRSRDTSASPCRSTGSRRQAACTSTRLSSRRSSAARPSASRATRPCPRSSGSRRTSACCRVSPRM